MELPASALVHLLLVELLPVFGFAIAAWSAGTKFMVHELMITRFFEGVGLSAQSGHSLHAQSGHSLHAQSGHSLPAQHSQPQRSTMSDHMHCINGAVQSFMWTYNDTAAFHCPGCGGTGFTCPRSFAPTAVPQAVFAAVGIIVLLTIWILVSFASRGLCSHSCGSGAYLYFTWELESRLPYRAVVYILALVTVLAAGLVMCVGVMSDDYESGFGVIHFIGMDALALIVCLHKMLAPRTGILHWISGREISAFEFKRVWGSIPRVIPEANDVFASKLVEALWQAANGRKKLLQGLLVDPAAADDLLAACRVMGPDENGVEMSSASDDSSAGSGRGRGLL